MSNFIPNQSSTPPAPPSEVVLGTTFSHRWFTLIGAAFILFEILFLILYTCDFWFPLNLSYLGVLAIVICLVLADHLLSWLESTKGCRRFAFIFKGRPPVAYRNWLVLCKSSIRYGDAWVTFESIDQLELTWPGNLLFRSRAVCGPDSPDADTVLKLPLGIAGASAQDAFFDQVQEKNPNTLVNHRLKKRSALRDVKLAPLIQSCSVGLMLLVLLDVGYSTFAYLEQVKHYYLVSTELKGGHRDLAIKHLADAETLRLHPFPLSLVTNSIFAKGVVAAGLEEMRAQSLLTLGLRAEALKAARQAVADAPDSFRKNLFLARLLDQAGHGRSARDQIRCAIRNHQHSLLPRLYLLAQLAVKHRPQSERLYQLYRDQLADEFFGETPAWPPGGEPFLSEVIRQEDLSFILDRLVPCNRP